MRIWILSYRFPPSNAIGAVRVQKIATHLARLGDEVTVVTPALGDPPQPIPGVRVLRTPYRNVNWIPERLSGGSERVAAQGYGSARGARAVAREVWLNAVAVPDMAVGWVPYARRAALALAQENRPDVLFASSWPPSSLMTASSAARKLRIPWVADFRDLWSGNPYSNLVAARARFDWQVERRTVRSAAALTTVSEPLAAELARMHGLPVQVVMNGYDPEDFPGQRDRDPDPRLVIRHMGTVYSDRRDPSPLFRALCDDEALRRSVRVQFYGRNLANLAELIDQYGVQDCVEICAPVSRSESLELQARADVLLLLTWNSPQDQGTLPGKLFEYMGIGRPILQVGAEQGLSADLIRAQHRGSVSASAEQTAQALRRWVRELSLTGQVGAAPPAPREYEREGQVRLLRDLLAHVAKT